MDLATFLVQCLNAVQYGLLLFLVASGLTLIFGIMGVINLAHGSFYMVGAYGAYALAPIVGKHKTLKHVIISGSDEKGYPNLAELMMGVSPRFEPAPTTWCGRIDRPASPTSPTPLGPSLRPGGDRP